MTSYEKDGALSAEEQQNRHLAEAKQLLADGSIEPAIQKLKLANSIGQRRAEICEIFGRALQQNEKPAESIPLLIEALELGGGKPFVHALLMNAYCSLGKPRLAIPHANAAKEIIIAKRSRAQFRAVKYGRRSIIVSYLPKSAATYILSAVECSLDLVRQPLGVRSRADHLNFYIVPALLDNYLDGGCVSHDHIPASPHNIATLQDRWNRPIWVHIRDPRDAATALFHELVGDGAGEGPVHKARVENLRRRRAHLAAAGYVTSAQLADYCRTTVLSEYLNFILGWVEYSRGNPGKVFFSFFEHLVSDQTSFFCEVEKSLILQDGTLSPNTKSDANFKNRYHFAKIGEWKTLFGEFNFDASTVDRIKRFKDAFAVYADD